MYGRSILILAMAILTGCATAPPKPLELTAFSPNAAHCLRLALESGAYDEPLPECR